MPAVQSPAKILKFWNKINKNWGAGKDAKKKLKEKGLHQKDKMALKQNEEITKGLTILRNVSRGGLKGSPSKIKRFEKTRVKMLRVMKKYCKLVKSAKNTEVASHKDLAKFRRSIKQFTVVVELINPTTLSPTDAEDETDLPLTAFSDVDTSALDNAMEDPNFGDYPDEEFDEEEEGEEESEEAVSSEASEPAESDLADQWNNRRDNLNEDLKKVLAAGKGEVDRIKNLFAQANAHVKTKPPAYERALEVLDELEPLVTATLQAGGEPVGAVKGMVGWQKARIETVNNIRKLQKMLLGTRVPAALEIAKELESIPKGLDVPPDSPGNVAKLLQFITTNETIQRAEGVPNPWNIKFNISSPLLSALQSLK